MDFLFLDRQRLLSDALSTMNRFFLPFAKFTLITVYLVIVAGSVVRTTGSGMGCPDWPRCFGKWVPPTDESQLPPNYHEVYHDRGYADTSFNVYHTWTEYLNRLLGAMLGFFVFILFVLSLQFRNNNKSITYLCGTSVLLTGFQGWLGALVVTSNLAPLKITLHMVVALSIVALLVYVVQKSLTPFGRQRLAEGEANPSPKTEGSRKIKITLIICLLFTVIQILIGTKVREKIDTVSYSMDYEFREKWIGLIGEYLDVHRIFAALIIGVNFYVLTKLKKSVSASDVTLKYTKLSVTFLFLEFLFGLILTYFAFPAFVQPLHLLMATIIFGAQFYALITYHKNEQL